MTVRVTCGDCGFLIGEYPQITDDQRHPCPACGSSKLLFGVLLPDGLKLDDFAQHKGRVGERGRPFVESREKAETFKLTGERRRIKYTANRREDRWDKVVTDQKTGRVVYECHGRLSDHQGRGSAKSKSRKKKSSAARKRP